MSALLLNMGYPSEKQRLFLEERHRYIAYGGARGGGKSWAVRRKAEGLALHHPGIRIMIVRKTYPELQENHIVPMCKEIADRRIAKYNDQKKGLYFRNGSVILFRYCDTERDMEHYQGAEFDVIFIDEATHHSEDVFRMFDACVRGVNEYPKRLYLTCNPGGIGHGWVKRLFIDKAYKDGENPDEYAFIQALVQDNTALMRAQPRYIKQLEALPPKLRDAWLYGKWDVYEGQFFEDFVDNPAGYESRIGTHVIPAFPPPRSWRRFRSFDFGYAKPFSCGWWAMDPHGVLYRILEYYVRCAALRAAAFAGGSASSSAHARELKIVRVDAELFQLIPALQKEREPREQAEAYKSRHPGERLFQKRRQARFEQAFGQREQRDREKKNQYEPNRAVARGDAGCRFEPCGRLAAGRRAAPAGLAKARVAGQNGPACIAEAFGRSFPLRLRAARDGRAAVAAKALRVA